jgi:seryl-tRNA synthetase
VYDGSLAIASVNFHRNFFGERCRIRTADEKFAFTGCVAFGIERWIQALLEVFRDDTEAIASAIRDCR